jgi:hypothetical protein
VTSYISASTLTECRTVCGDYNGDVASVAGAGPCGGPDAGDDGRADGDGQGATDWRTAREDSGGAARRGDNDDIPGGQHVGLAGAARGRCPRAKADKTGMMANLGAEYQSWH